MNGQRPVFIPCYYIFSAWFMAANHRRRTSRFLNFEIAASYFCGLTDVICCWYSSPPCFIFNKSALRRFLREYRMLNWLLDTIVSANIDVLFFNWVRNLSFYYTYVSISRNGDTQFEKFFYRRSDDVSGIKNGQLLLLSNCPFLDLSLMSQRGIYKVIVLVVCVLESLPLPSEA